MKNKFMRFITIFTLVMMTVACEKDEKPETIEGSNLKFMARAGSSGISWGDRSCVLFTYSTYDEAKEIIESGKMQNFLDELQRESNSIVGSVRSEATLEFTNGTVLLLEYGFLDLNDNIIEFNIWNPINNEYITSSGGPAGPAACPAGMTSLGTCSKVPVEDCIRRLMIKHAVLNQTYTVSNLNHGLTFHISQSSDSVRVCGGLR